MAIWQKAQAVGLSPGLVRLLRAVEEGRVIDITSASILRVVCRELHKLRQDWLIEEIKALPPFQEVRNGH